MDLSNINIIANSKRYLKSIVKLNTLELNHPYPIVQLEILDTKYGESVRAELDEVMVYLPQRTLELFKENIKKFSPNKYSLKYTGAGGQYKGHNIENFEIVLI